jgi:hypothetical protein
MKSPPAGWPGANQVTNQGRLYRPAATIRMRRRPAADRLPGYGARQLDGHRRRYDAAGRTGDPLSPAEVADCRPRGRQRNRRPSPKMVDAGAAAAEHLLDIGLTPILPIEMLRAMWRAGHHRLVDRVRTAYGLAS